jgi:hypothetical protein
MLDWLRAAFPYIVAIVLPLAGLVLALARYVEQDRDEAVRLAAASAVGFALYALLFL